jgi:hypothetical protein
VKQFLIISSLGADKAAGNFYLKTKEKKTILNNLVLQVFLFETFFEGKEFRLEKIGAFHEDIFFLFWWS